MHESTLPPSPLTWYVIPYTLKISLHSHLRLPAHANAQQPLQCPRCRSPTRPASPAPEQRPPHLHTNAQPDSSAKESDDSVQPDAKEAAMNPRNAPLLLTCMPIMPSSDCVPGTLTVDRMRLLHRMQNIGYGHSQLIGPRAGDSYCKWPAHGAAQGPHGATTWRYNTFGTKGASLGLRSAQRSCSRRLSVGQGRAPRRACSWRRA